MNSLQKNKYIDIIQIFRGVAALMIIVHHSYTSFSYYQHINIPFLSFIASVGKYGVDFFFVLSGFIITYSSYNKSGIKEGKTYFLHRLIRIYIPYIPISIILLILHLILPSFSNSNRDISVLTSLTLIPNGPPILSVAWTLVYEMFFYSVFIIFIISKKSWNIFVLLWIAGIVLYNCFFTVTSKEAVNSLIVIVFAKYNVEFILGYILAALIYKSFKLSFYISFGSLCFFLVLFLYSKSHNIMLFDFEYNYLFALFCFFLIYTTITYLNLGINKFNIFMLVGNATFSIYLIHNPLQALLTRYLPRVNYWVFFLEFLFVIAVCCLIGYLYYSVFEVYIMKKVKKSFR